MVIKYLSYLYSANNNTMMPAKLDRAMRKAIISEKLAYSCSCLIFANNA